MSNYEDSIAKTMAEQMKNFQELSKYEEILKHNTVEFEIDKVFYRVRRLKPIEKQELLKQKALKFGELIKEPNWQFRNQITEACKAKGYDVDKLDKQVARLQSEIDDLYEKLANMSEENRIASAKTHIRSLEYEQALANKEKTDLYQFSIEDYLEFYVKSYFGYLVTDKCIDEKWIKCFKNYEEFNNSENYELVQTIAHNVILLIYAGELS